ncbi:MAG TPA: Hsp20/alpha crystallin family protein [Mycobacteriales bacterium]|nr:Hsp20/alpha crystallin family protein [Mycobacteriales bacterium]
MVIMTRWDASHDLRAAQNRMYQMMFFAAARGQAVPPSRTGTTSTPARAPAVDFSEREDAYLVTAELPGVKVDDLEISYHDGQLTIQGQPRSAQDTGPQQSPTRERRYRPFHRSITLPPQVQADAIRASAADGVLQVVVPKQEAAKPTRIKVNADPAPTAATA